MHESYYGRIDADYRRDRVVVDVDRRRLHTTCRGAHQRCYHRRMKHLVVLMLVAGTASADTYKCKPEVAKNATRLVIAAPNDMTPKQALKLFIDSMDAAGLVATDKGDTITIKPGK